MPREIDDIEWQAAAWIAKIEVSPLPPAAQKQLDDWLAEDPRHVGAYLRANAIVCAVTENVLLERGQMMEFSRTRFINRRRLVLTGGIAATIAAISVYSGIFESAGDPETYTTSLGQHRTVPLPDGSVVTLNTNSSITVRFSSRVRDIRLNQGEALFDVAKDPSRPFVVHEREMQVRAVGTSFSVSAVPDRPLQVLVREGVVRVDQVPNSTGNAVTLTANMRLVAGDGKAPKIVKLSSDESEQELAWRSGHIFLQHCSLATAADEFRRYTDTMIVVDDPVAARLTVSGLYAANDPLGFARAAALSLGLNVVVKGKIIHISSKV